MKIILLCIMLLLFLSPLSAQERLVNYNETKVGNYTLPKILKIENGGEVKSLRQWENVRRPKILSLFENEVYGLISKNFDRINYSILNIDEDAMNGKATLKEVQIEVWRNGKRVQLKLVLFVPNEREKPVPAFLLINNRELYNTDPTRYIRSEFWPAEQVIEEGYAVASFQVDDAAPDDKETYAEGVLKLYPEQLLAENGMKAIGSWAWAASRVMDYFEKNEDIDATRIALVGHSRGGKAALWAAAQDQRFGMVVSNNSGNTGAALSRRNFGETVAIINTSFPHWFCDNYKEYNGKEHELPVDQHMLLALIAPRPLYITSASKDLWADPKGTFLAMKEAEGVYDLYGSSSKLPEKFPEGTFLTFEEKDTIYDLTSGFEENITPVEPVIKSPLGYHIRNGKHNLTEYDWGNFIRFADFHLKGDRKMN